MTPDTDGALRDEIAQTRADLGDTVEALAAKADVKARTKGAVGDLADQVETTARGLAATAAGRVSDAAGTVGVKVRSNVADVRESLADGDVIGAARTPLPIAGLAVAVALLGLVIYVIRRRGA